MTKDEIIKKVEWMTTSSVELSQPVLVYNDGFKDGANFVLQNLQQTQCTALLEFLEQELRKEKKAADQASREMDFLRHARNREHIEYVMKLIKEHQPIA